MRKINWNLEKAAKRTLFLAFLILLPAATAGCGAEKISEEKTTDRRMKIVCTIFPEYDWVKQILGVQAEETELTLLMKNGVDLHSYQPTVWDMKAISEADLLIYVGGESDFWMEAALANTKNPDVRTLNLMELLEDALRREDHEGHEHHEEEEEEYDEHVWLSLKNAGTVCGAITDMLCEMDREHRDIYEQNNAEYQEKLQELDFAYRKTIEQAPVTTLLFGDRFPFRYLAEDYGLTCYAAFSGCSAETEASFGMIVSLSEKAEELKLPAVMKTDGSDGRIAGTIAGSAKGGNRKVLLLDSMQSVSGQDLEAGETYLAIMERNLYVLKEALAVTGGE